MKLIYEPSDDSYLLKEVLDKKIKNKKLKILEIGTGSGFILDSLKKREFKNLLGSDINNDSVKHCKKMGLIVIHSDLFSEIKEKFDIIIFNPPYLPENKNEDNRSKLATTGGKYGSEIINIFLKKAKAHLNKKGKIYLLTSTLTKKINWLNYKRKIIMEKKLFFEKLIVWELSV